jgi:hypothetical protein
MGTGSGWDAVRVILTAEGDGVLRPVEEGRRSLLRGEDLVPFPLALAVGHVDGRPPEDEEDVLHSGEAAGVAVTPILLRFAILRPIEGLPEGLEGPPEGPIELGQQLGPCRHCCRAPGRAPYNAASFLSSPACASAGGPWTCFPPRARRPRACPSSRRRSPPPPPHRRQSWWRCRTTRRAAPEFVHEVPAGGTLEEGVHDFGLGHAWELCTALGEASYEIPE